MFLLLHPAAANIITELLSCQIREKQQQEKITQQTTRDTLQAKREADRIFSEKQQLRVQRMREDARKLQQFHAAQMVMLKLFPTHMGSLRMSI